MGKVGKQTTAGERAVLPTALRAPLGLLSVLAALTVAVLGVLLSGHREPGAVDHAVQSAVGQLQGTAQSVALDLDFLGEPRGAALLVAVLVLVTLPFLRSARASALLVLGACLTVATTTLLKHLVGRTIHGPGNLSYPSGHTALLTALALAVALPTAARAGLGRTAGTLLALTASLLAGAAAGWAQIGLGAHYPTDALAGWCTALAVVPATAWLVDRAADAGRRRRQ